jgi:hypothetical protein
MTCMQTPAISTLHFVHYVLVLGDIGGISSRAHRASLNIMKLCIVMCGEPYLAGIEDLFKGLKMEISSQPS